MSTLITGATGFVGRALLPLTDNPMILSRDGSRASARLGLPVRAVTWEPCSGPLRSPELASNPPRVVFNLMGESVAEGRWTAAKKQRIGDSRILGTRNLVAGLRKLDRLPEVFVSASAVGYYGDGGENELTEEKAPGTGFLAGVCNEWEQAAMELAADGVRVVLIRIGLVLGTGGGVLKTMLPVYRWCLGGRLGWGRQWMPWIHLDDLVRLMLWAAENPQVVGPVNAGAPAPVRNSEFNRAMASAAARPAWLMAPRWGLRIALGEFAESLFFSQRMIPQRALKGGFQFHFEELQPTLNAIVKQSLGKHS